jgi:hypothetical protein
MDWWDRDVPLWKMRTYKAMKKSWDDRGRERKRKKDDADYGNQINAPILPIDTSQSPLDWLHAVLRIVGKFEDLHAILRNELGINKKDGDAAYLKNLHDAIGINREITGLTGNECVRILRKPKEYLAMVEKHKKHGALLSCLRQFEWLHLHASGRGCTPIEWRDRARVFGKEMVKAFGDDASGCVYLHAVVNHAWRWMEWTHEAASFHALGGRERGGGILPWTTQGLEAVNKKLKHNKKMLSAQQPLRATRKKKQGTGKEMAQLLQIVKRQNNESSEFAYVHRSLSTAAPHQCSLCYDVGHNRRTCPLQPPPPSTPPPAAAPPSHEQKEMKK